MKGVSWDPEIKETVLKMCLEEKKPYKDSVAQFGIPYKTVAQWCWRKRKELKESGKEVPSLRRNAPLNNKKAKRRGAPLNNKNAKGSKGPVGRKNAKKHGAYSAVLFGDLEEGEKSFLDDLPETSEELLLDQLKILTVREYRLLRIIKDFSEKQMYLKIRTVTRKGSAEDLEGDNVTDVATGSTKAISGTVTTTEYNSMELIIRIEHELTTVQIAIRETVLALAAVRAPSLEITSMHVQSEKLKIELMDARIEQLDARTNKLLSILETEDMSETDSMIYGSGNM